MSGVNEIRMEKGDFVFVRKGKSEPLIYQDLQLILLRNAERFVLGEISAEQHEMVYSRCLEIEQTGRSIDAERTERQSKQAASGCNQASARA